MNLTEMVSYEPLEPL